MNFYLWDWLLNKHLQTITRMNDSLNFCLNSHQCLLVSNRKGDNLLNFCPNSRQCPNTPCSIVS